MRFKLGQHVARASNGEPLGRVQSTYTERGHVWYVILLRHPITVDGLTITTAEFHTSELERA